MHVSILCALGAAFLFGASTPFAKSLGGDIPAVLLAGLLYLGSGVGLGLIRCIRDRGFKPSGLPADGWPWLLGVAVFGGVLGPAALMLGLSATSAATASLLLNLEAVLTAVIAWLVFKENAGRRVVLGMVVIVLGGLVLGWPEGLAASNATAGPLWVALACLCWAIDNNLTRKVSASDALFIAAFKGLMAGSTNTLLALGMGAVLPPATTLAATMGVGLLGYGVSLVLFVLALRGLGTARTGAYFSTAPFMGAAVALGAFGESTTAAFWAAATLMALGVWLHLTEDHNHLHRHEAMEHDHVHHHDEHHQHTHAFAWSGLGPHAHPHRHETLEHSHAHYPDIHHRHGHG